MKGRWCIAFVGLSLSAGGFGCGERFNHQISHEQKVEAALDALDARLSAIEVRLTKIEGRLTRLEGKGAPDGGTGVAASGDEKKPAH